MSLFSSLLAKSTKDIEAVCDIDITKYLGTWYEIARLPHSFEKGLENVTANYQLREDGKIQVINTGYKQGKRNEAQAVAWIINPKCTGRLYVSFFWLVKSEYKIIYIDREYKLAVVTSCKRNYLWILSRTPEIEKQSYIDLVNFAAVNGFDVKKLIKVAHKKIDF